MHARRDGGLFCKSEKIINTFEKIFRMQKTPLGGAPESSVDLGILVGILLTDGSISRKGRSFSIELSGKSKELIRLLFGVEKFLETRDSRYPEIFRTILTNRNVAESLLKFSPTFRTKQFPDGKFPPAKLPEFIFKLNQKEKSAVLSAMFSCDGCISLWIVWNKKWKVWEIKKWVKFACKHPRLRKQTFQLLKSLGYSPVVREINDEILLAKKKDIIKFAREIRFVDGVKVTGDSRNWEGFRKNEVLDFAVKSYDIKQDTIRNFSRKDLHLFIKSSLASGGRPFAS